MAGVGLSKNSKMICAPLMAKSVDQILNDMHQAKMEGADVVEIRLDQINDFDPRRHLKLIIENKPLPVAIVFNSLICQGGQYKGDEEERLQALFLAKDVGADYIDLELKLASQLSEEGKLSQLGSSKIIVSCYLSNLTILNDDSSHLVAKLQSIKADIIKFVSTTANITEVANIFNLLSHIQIPVISYSTGERGLTNQLLNFKFGGVWAYGSIKGNPVPGLPTISSLRQAYDVKNINEDTRVFGLISKPVSHSKGPLLHNPTFRHVGYNGIYVPMLVDDLKDFFHVYSNPDFAGFSVGIPYKEAVISLCDEVHPLAQAIGAVNTIIRRPDNGKLIGYNTDCEAAITAIEDALRVQGCITPPITGKMFVVVGAGGAGRALAFGAKTRGGQVVVFDIDYDRAKALAAAVSAKAHPFEDLLGFEPEEGAILANATPLGMHPNTDRIPVPEETLRKYELVFDAVYSPRKTRLLKEAEAAGAIVVSGVEMFLRQAAAQFSLFTSLKAPEEFMREIVLKNF